MLILWQFLVKTKIFFIFDIFYINHSVTSLIATILLLNVFLVRKKLILKGFCPGVLYPVLTF